MSVLSNKLKFIEKAELIHNNEYDYSLVEYLGSLIKVKIICPDHGEFEQLPSNHLQGRGCPICAKTKIKNSLIFSINKFIKLANEKHNFKYNYSKAIYVSSKDKITITCTIHGDYKQKVSSHLMGYGCPKCGYINRKLKTTKTIDEFIKKANLKHNNEYVYNKTNYINASTKITIICQKHGEFEQLPSNHLSGNGCPICNESKGEKNIREYLTNNNINFIRQYRFNDCKDKKTLPFDFYLPDYNTCIEYNGPQHYKSIPYWGGEKGFKSQQLRDKIKMEYCINTNIPLIVIKYDEDIINKLSSVFDF